MPPKIYDTIIAGYKIKIYQLFMDICKIFSFYQRHALCYIAIGIKFPNYFYKSKYFYKMYENKKARFSKPSF